MHGWALHLSTTSSMLCSQFVTVFRLWRLSSVTLGFKEWLRILTNVQSIELCRESCGIALQPVCVLYAMSPHYRCFLNLLYCLHICGIGTPFVQQCSYSWYSDEEKWWGAYPLKSAKSPETSPSVGYSTTRCIVQYWWPTNGLFDRGWNYYKTYLAISWANVRYFKIQNCPSLKFGPELAPVVIKFKSVNLSHIASCCILSRLSY